MVFGGFFGMFFGRSKTSENCDNLSASGSLAPNSEFQSPVATTMDPDYNC